MRALRLREILMFSAFLVCMKRGKVLEYINELRLNYSLAEARPQLSFVGIAYGG
jgi:hypothetical protein